MPKSVLFLSFLSLMTSSESLGEGSKRMIGGRDAKRGEIPYVLALEVASVLRMENQCTYSLITVRTALGTAHCVYDILFKKSIPLSDVSLSGGNTDRNAGEILPILTVFIHDNFTFAPIRNDISTVILKEPIKSKFRIKRIALPAQGRTFVGRKAKAAGWGANEIGSPHNTAILKVVDVTVISQNRCADFFPRATTSYSLCAEAQQGVTTPGDLGSPLIVTDRLADVLIGFEHKGFSTTQTPSLYVAISSFIPWIRYNSVGKMTIVSNELNEHV